MGVTITDDNLPFNGPPSNLSPEVLRMLLYVVRDIRKKPTGFICVECNYSRYIYFVNGNITAGWDDLYFLPEEFDTHMFANYPAEIRCTDCRRNAEAYKRVRKYGEEVYQRSVETKTVPFAITVTLGNDVEKRVGHTTPKELCKLLKSKMNRLRYRSKSWKTIVLGGMQSFETTIKEVDGVEVYHPHLHLVALVKREYISNNKIQRDYFNQLTADIKTYTQSKYAFIEHCYIKNKHGKKQYAASPEAVHAAIWYALYYSCKGSMKGDSETQVTLGFRTISKFGVMIHKEQLETALDLW